MAENSSIEWTDHTVNWWWGCVVATHADGSLSEACRNCYAETFAKRTGRAKWGPRQPRWFPNFDRLASNLRKWNKRAAEAGVVERVFCNSMSDFFELHQVPEEAAKLDEARAHAFALMEECTSLRFLVLTKRPENVLGMVPRRWVAQWRDFDGPPEVFAPRWPDNVWIGTTVEDQQSADERIPHLLKVPALVRFLSCEPLLGPVDLGIPYAVLDLSMDTTPSVEELQAVIEGQLDIEGVSVGVTYPGIHWVIAGGESGHGARPMHPDWVRDLRDQCLEAGVPFHFKQWGAWCGQPGAVTRHVIASQHPERVHHFGPTRDERVYRVGKKAAGRRLDGETWDGMPSA